jgi:hypothetical protein
LKLVVNAPYAKLQYLVDGKRVQGEQAHLSCVPQGVEGGYHSFSGLIDVFWGVEAPDAEA